MNRRRALALIAPAALAPSALTLAPRSVRAAEPTKLKVVSYNVQFLPGPGRIANKRKNLPYRAERLGKEMAKYDIACLQETFDDEPREILIKQLKEAWGAAYHAVVHPVPPQPSEHRYNGGLLIASRLPILESHHCYYEHYSSPKDYGPAADGFAGKGMLHARLARAAGAAPDDYIDVFCTHLEARDDKMRAAQYPEMAAFIKERADPKRPSLLFGDLNTHGMDEDRANPDSPYSLLMKNLGEAGAGRKWIDLWPAVKPGQRGGTSIQETTEKGSRIDYIILANPAPPGPQIKPIDLRVNPYLDKEVIALSDHSSVEADLEWPAAT